MKSYARVASFLLAQSLVIACSCSVEDDVEGQTDAAIRMAPDGHVGPADAGRLAKAGGNADSGNADSEPRTQYPAEYCAYFLTGEIDLAGVDADGDGIPNGWDHCPNNANDWLDSDRDGVGNHFDPDMDGDGVPNDEDPDRDGDSATDTDENAAGTDPIDPSSIPGLARFNLDLGVLNSQAGWYWGDMHVHSEASHDSTDPVGNYVAAAQRAGLDFIWITDHRTFQAPFDPAWDQREVLFIPAIEWGGAGHANQGGIRTNNEVVDSDPDDVRRSWRQARLQGAVQSLNHYGKDADYWDRLFADAPELLDQIDVMEIWSTLWFFNQKTNAGTMAFWQELLSAGYRIGAVGGSDTHASYLTLGIPTTVVWAKTLSVPGILEGVRHGRTYITAPEPFFGGSLFNYSGRAELDFRVDADGDGVFEAMLGDVVVPGLLTFQIAVRNAHGPVVLIRDGIEIARFDQHTPGADISETFVDSATAGAWYRVEMKQNARALASMLLLSSPIYVAAP